MMKNKKASTFAIWFEIILFSLLFVLVLGIISSNLNSIHGTNNDLTFGIATSDTLQDMKDLQTSLNTAQTEGQSSITTLGFFMVTTLPRMIMLTLSTTLKFIGGGWISKLAEIMNLGEYATPIVVILTILYWMMIIFILIKIITRINP